MKGCMFIVVNINCMSDVFFEYKLVVNVIQFNCSCANDYSHNDILNLLSSVPADTVAHPSGFSIGGVVSG